MLSFIPPKSRLSLITLVLVSGGLLLFYLLSPPCSGEKNVFCDQRQPVLFPHEMHMGLYDCLDCHHDYDQEKNNILDPGTLYVGNPEVKCSFCHHSDSTLNRREAFHGQCLYCHLKTGPIDRTPFPPGLCGQCHAGPGPLSESDLILGEAHD
ncbi:MAG: cytochrome c3 family protein [Desulfosudaceae bacterium]